MQTWFMRTSMPAFSPFATESSSKFSKRFFSLTTGFRKSVTSTWGAYRGSIGLNIDIVKTDGCTTYQLFIKVYLYDALNHVSDMNKFEKLHQWCNRCRCWCWFFRVGRQIRKRRRLIRPHLCYGPSITGLSEINSFIRTNRQLTLQIRFAHVARQAHLAALPLSLQLSLGPGRHKSQGNCQKSLNV